MENKYVNIEIEGEGNIGVIDLGVIDYAELSENNAKLVKERLEPKLVQALESHFDCPIKIRLTEVLNVTGHIHVNVTVVIESENSDYEETVVLMETWIY